MVTLRTILTMLYPVIGFERIDPLKDSQGLSFGITTIVLGDSE